MRNDGCVTIDNESAAARSAALAHSPPLLMLLCGLSGGRPVNGTAASNVDSECELANPRAARCACHSWVCDSCETAALCPLSLAGPMTAAALLTALHGVTHSCRITYPQTRRSADADCLVMRPVASIFPPADCVCACCSAGLRSLGCGGPALARVRSLGRCLAGMCSRCTLS